MNEKFESRYCLCSNKSFTDILKSQTLEPLPFDEMVDTYTDCNAGCGSCIEYLREIVNSIPNTYKISKENEHS